MVGGLGPATTRLFGNPSPAPRKISSEAPEVGPGGRRRGSQSKGMFLYLRVLFCLFLVICFCLICVFSFFELSWVDCMFPWKVLVGGLVSSSCLSEDWCISPGFTGDRSKSFPHFSRGVFARHWRCVCVLFGGMGGGVGGGGAWF